MDYNVIDEIYYSGLEFDEHEKTLEYAQVAKYREQAEALVQSLTDNKQVLIAISDSKGVLFINNLINIQSSGGTPMVSSREVAEDFKKCHADILSSIDILMRNLSSTKNSVQSYFTLTAYKDSNQQFNAKNLTTSKLRTLIM